ncbi:nucleoid-associated protein [Ignatzschineria sp. LJL83]
MLNISSAKIEKIIIHQVGNGGREELCLFSENSTTPSASLESLLLEHYLLPLTELEDTFEFNVDELNDEASATEESSDTNQIANLIADYSERIFTDSESFQEVSVDIAKHLYSVTNHPNIAGGDFIIILFSGIFADMEDSSEGISEPSCALGIFKVESKDDYLDIFDNHGTLEFVEKEGISLKDIQKGALIFAHDYSVLAIDSLKKRTKYWHDDFLNLKPKQTEIAELKASKELYQGLSKRIEAPNQRLEFNQRLEAHLDEHEEIKFSDLENYSRSFVEEPDIHRVFNAVQNRSGFEIDRDIAVPSAEFREKSKGIMKKMSVAKGVDLMISNPDTYLNGITIEETEKGFRAVINFDVYSSDADQSEE